MNLRVTNNRKAPYGIELSGGGYAFIAPGKTRVVDAVNPGPLYDREGLDVEAADNEVKAPPASLKAKAGKARVLDVEEALTGKVVKDKPDPLDHDANGRKGGSRKGPRRRKASTR